MKDFLKAFWHVFYRYIKLLGIQVLILFFFLLMLFDNNVLNIIVGIVVFLILLVIFFFIGKGQALGDFKFKRQNELKYGDNVPLSAKVKEMRLSKTGAVCACFVVPYVFFMFMGAFGPEIARTSFVAVLQIAFLGIMFFMSGINASSFITSGGGGVIAVFLPVILLVAAAYFVGYYVSAAQRTAQHNEIQEEIRQFRAMGKKGR